MNIPPSSAFLFRKVAILALISAFSPATSAQLIGGSDIQSSILQQQLPSAAASALTSESVTLEGPIDPNTYFVGPGDGFDLSIGGQFPLSRRIRVSADGTLVIPDVGSFDTADRTLGSVQSEMRSAIRRHFRNVDTDIVLAEPRQFYIHVSGAVLIPGRHVMTPIARVDDALVVAMAGVRPQQLIGLAPSRQALAARAINVSEAVTLEPASLTPAKPLIPHSEYLPAFRNVVVTHRDGTSDRVDLLLYYATGSIAANPYLRDGDAISVQFFDPSQESVGVAGAVAEPGVYDYRPDDTALSVLLIAFGPDAESQIGEVRLLRTSGGSPLAQILNAAELATTPLEPGDRLFVLPNDAMSGTAEVAGATYFPSSYPIRVGETTLRDLVNMAGGFLPDALIRGAYLEREPVETDAERAPENSQLALEPTFRSDIREGALASAAFDLTRLSTLSYVEKRYLAREFVDKHRVSLDFEVALRDDASPIYLRDGDRVVVPHDLGSVYVFGQVRRSGHVPYLEGQSVENYVALAGGQAAGATDTYVLAASGAVVPADQAGPVRSGDLVFVNRMLGAEDRNTQNAVIQERSMGLQENRARSDAQFRIIATVLSAISTALTAILVFRTSNP